MIQLGKKKIHKAQEVDKIVFSRTSSAQIISFLERKDKKYTFR